MRQSQKSPVPKPRQAQIRQAKALIESSRLVCSFDSPSQPLLIHRCSHGSMRAWRTTQFGEEQWLFKIRVARLSRLPRQSSLDMCIRRRLARGPHKQSGHECSLSPCNMSSTSKSVLKQRSRLWLGWAALNSAYIIKNGRLIARSKHWYCREAHLADRH